MNSNIDDRIKEVRQALDQLEGTLATLTRLVRDIEPSYCTDTDLAALYSAQGGLELVESRLADLCADNCEAQEDGEFPFEAWDMIGQRPVTVLGWTEPIRSHYRIEPGNYARPDSVTTVFPAWYQRHLDAEADAANERETLDDVRNGGACQ